MLKIHLGARQAPFWKGMGLSWVPLERHLASFGALLGVSWRFWGASWALLGRCPGCIPLQIQEIVVFISAWVEKVVRGHLEGLAGVLGHFGGAFWLS